MNTELKISDDIHIMFMSHHLSEGKNYTHTLFRLVIIYNISSFPIGLRRKV